MDIKKQILVVDDEQDILELMSKMLTKDGYDVITADSGHKAERILRGNEKIEIVLSDIKMPDGNGMELLQDIKREDPKKPFVVVFTGFYDFSIDELFDKGACAVIMKPFDWSVMEKTIKEQLKPFPKFKKPHMEQASFALLVEESFRSFSDVHVGQGGVFIRTKKELKDGDLVKFNFTFKEGEPKTFDGIAEVAWQRLEETNGLPAGIGAKFINLSEDTERFINEYTISKNIAAYIPKA